MKRHIILIVIFAICFAVADAQPQAKRETSQKKTQSSASVLTQRAKLMFPTATDMPSDVVWRRDIYRELDLTSDANAGLYYPTEPVDRQMNLFTYIFRLALSGYINVYEYRLDGNESFSTSSKVSMKTILDNYHIYYEERDGKIRVDNSDIPSAEVTRYYLKESAYYDQANASFHRRVLALCPVMMREDDFGGEAAKYPIFWVRYSDLEPYLNRQTIQTSSLNNAASMTMNDFFTLNRYEGSIYKTSNLLGRTLAQYCPTDSAMAKEQRRIEAELEAFENNLFGSVESKDSLDSIAKVDPKVAKAMAKAEKAENRRTSTTVKKAKSSSSSGSPRVTVRRERH